jgi:polynucleotide 5'-hydroxyl-kinase GRC3/NOL9
MLIRDGLNVRIIDADIGQADIGPPGTISLAAPARCFTSLVDLQASRRLFMGHVTPSYVEPKLFDGIRRLTNIDRESRSLTLINTDGWIIGSDAVLNKAKLIFSFKLDLVIGISTDSELQPILSISKPRSILVQAAKKALRRSRSDRRLIRQSKYRRFLENAGVRNIPLNTTRIRKPRNFPTLRLNALNPEFKNLLVGLSDKDGFLLQIGILMDVDSRSIHIFSRSVEHVRNVEFGYIHLLPDGTEIGYVDR